MSESGQQEDRLGRSVGNCWCYSFAEILMCLCRRMWEMIVAMFARLISFLRSSYAVPRHRRLLPRDHLLELFPAVFPPHVDQAHSSPPIPIQPQPSMALFLPASHRPCIPGFEMCRLRTPAPESGWNLRASSRPLFVKLPLTLRSSPEGGRLKPSFGTIVLSRDDEEEEDTGGWTGPSAKVLAKR